MSLTARTAVALLSLFLTAPLAHAQSSPPAIQTAQAATIVVNGQAISPSLLTQLGIDPRQVPAGSYWYDARSGVWGLQGQPVAGILPAGLALGGPLASDASAGRTGVFINGRQLPTAELQSLNQRVGQPIAPGRYWCDAQASCGVEGNPTPLVNLARSNDHVTSTNNGHHYSVDGAVGGCFEGAGGKMVCWDEGIGSSTY